MTVFQDSCSEWLYQKECSLAKYAMVVNIHQDFYSILFQSSENQRTSHQYLDPSTSWYTSQKGPAFEYFKVQDLLPRVYFKVQHLLSQITWILLFSDLRYNNIQKYTEKLSQCMREPLTKLLSPRPILFGNQDVFWESRMSNCCFRGNE